MPFNIVRYGKKLSQALDASAIKRFNKRATVLRDPRSWPSCFGMQPARAIVQPKTLQRLKFVWPGSSVGRAED